MPKRFVLILVLTLLQTVVRAEVVFPRTAPSEGSADVTFRDFNGVNLPPPPRITQQLGIGWIRDGFPWGGIEPQKGQWNWEKTDRMVQAAHAQGAEMLPLLAYTAAWAASIPGKQFSPPKQVEDWEDFVEHVVAHYSSAPFNLRYFQVWNEPTQQAGFWLGTPEEYIDRIYIPAAKVIRQHHCFVVFGGWPGSNSLQQFDQVLTYHDAWRWTDIVDIHYQNPPAWQHLYDTWIRTGKCRGIWESEIGYTGDPDYLATTYLRLLAWALRSGWNDPNQYKVFWFAIWGNAQDRLGHLTMPVGNDTYHLTQNGIELQTINAVLGNGSLAAFNEFATQPPMPALLVGGPGAFGFKVGTNRVVIGLLVGQVFQQRGSAIQMQVSVNHKPRQVQLVNASGDRTPLAIDYRGDKLNVNLPAGTLRMNCPKCQWAVAYVQIDTP